MTYPFDQPIKRRDRGPLVAARREARTFAAEQLNRISDWQFEIARLHGVLGHGSPTQADLEALEGLRKTIQAERSSLKTVAAGLPSSVSQQSAVIDLFRALDSMAERIDRIQGPRTSPLR